MGVEPKLRSLQYVFDEGETLTMLVLHFCLIDMRSTGNSISHATSHESPEFLPLLRHLFHDVVRAEDGLEIQPCGLTRQPVVQHVLQRLQLGLPGLQ